MTQMGPSSGNAPSAEELKERVDAMSEQMNLGVGDQESDPATAGNPPSDVKAGDQARATVSEEPGRLDTGVRREENIDPASPQMHPGDQGG